MQNQYHLLRCIYIVFKYKKEREQNKNSTTKWKQNLVTTEQWEEVNKICTMLVFGENLVQNAPQMVYNSVSDCQNGQIVQL